MGRKYYRIFFFAERTCFYFSQITLTSWKYIIFLLGYLFMSHELWVLMRRSVLLQAQPVCWFLWAPTEAWVVYHKSLPCPHINSDFCLQIFIRIGKFFSGPLTPNCRLRQRAASQNNQWKLSWFKTETHPLWRLMYFCFNLHSRFVLLEIQNWVFDSFMAFLPYNHFYIVKIISIFYF